MQRVGVQHHRLRQRHQRRAEHALQQAEQHHLVDVLRQAAQHEAIVKPPEQMMKMRLRPKRLAIQPTGAVMIAARRCRRSAPS
jgi:hypothetical protein